jgi:hypothetical protein
VSYPSRRRQNSSGDEASTGNSPSDPNITTGAVSDSTEDSPIELHDLCKSQAGHLPPPQVDVLAENRKIELMALQFIEEQFRPCRNRQSTDQHTLILAIHERLEEG